MLTKSLKISETTKTEFFELILFRVIKKYDKNTVVEIYAVFGSL